MAGQGGESLHDAVGGRKMALQRCGCGRDRGPVRGAQTGIRRKSGRRNERAGRAAAWGGSFRPCAGRGWGRGWSPGAASAIPCAARVCSKEADPILVLFRGVRKLSRGAWSVRCRATPPGGSGTTGRGFVSAGSRLVGFVAGQTLAWYLCPVVGVGCGVQGVSDHERNNNALCERYNCRKAVAVVEAGAGCTAHTNAALLCVQLHILALHSPEHLYSVF